MAWQPIDRTGPHSTTRLGRNPGQSSVLLRCTREYTVTQLPGPLHPPYGMQPTANGLGIVNAITVGRLFTGAPHRGYPGCTASPCRSDLNHARTETRQGMVQSGLTALIVSKRLQNRVSLVSHRDPFWDPCSSRYTSLQLPTSSPVSA